MTIGPTDDARSVESPRNKHSVENRNARIGDWAIHSWGNSKFPGMAAVSAIATLQLSATLSEDPIDRIAMNQAAEYLTKALASQIKSFQQTSEAE